MYYIQSVDVGCVMMADCLCHVLYHFFSGAECILTCMFESVLLETNKCILYFELVTFCSVTAL